MERVSAGARVEKEDEVEVEVKGNQLLAGYLAHEFLTKGTLMGQRWGPARAVAETMMKRGAAAADRAKPAPMGSYADVAQLVKAEGAYVPGVVNPAELAGWLQMETRPEPTRSDPFKQIL